MTIAGQLRRLALGKDTAVTLTTGLLAVLGGDAPMAEALTVDAKASDARRSKGLPIGPLEGIPVAVTDDFIAPGATEDTGAVARLRRAGAVVFGGMTGDEVTRVVAQGLIRLGIGIDRIGHVHHAVAAAGVWALRPSRGLIGASGLRGASWTFDSVTPLASNAKDLAHGLFVLSGADLADPFSDARPMLAPRRGGLSGVTLGVPEELSATSLGHATARVFDAALQRARVLGINVIAVSVPGWEAGHLRRAAEMVMGAEAASIHTGVSASADLLTASDAGQKSTGPDVAAAYRRIALTRPACLFALDGIDGLILPINAASDPADLTCLASAAGLPAVTFPLGEGSVHLIGAPYADARIVALAGAMSKG